MLGFQNKLLFVEGFREVGQCTPFYSAAQISHQALIIMQVMEGIEHSTQHLLALVHVM